MDASAHLLSFALRGADLLVASLWQGVLLIAAAALGLQLARRLTPVVRSRMLAIVLLIAVGLAVWPLFWRRNVVVQHGAVHLPSAWAFAVIAAWLAAALYRAGRLCWSAVHVRRLAQSAKPVMPEDGLAELLNGARGALLCSSDQVDRPSIAGILRPRILVPKDLFATLSPAEMAQVLLHEREHLRRGDDWWNLLQQFCLVFLPLHPALLWLNRQISRERELACDDEVLKATQARKAYASCLVKIAEDSIVRRSLDLALSLLGSRSRSSELVSRVQRILGSTHRVELSRRTQTLALASVTLAILLGTAGAARNPQLVTFDAVRPAVATTPLVAEAVAAERAVGNFRPVAFEPQRNRPEARPVLTRAVFTGLPRLKEARSARLRSARLRRLSVKSRTLAEDLPQPSTQPRIRRPETRVVLTRVQVLQPVYAAVPWQDGWLIVQL